MHFPTAGIAPYMYVTWRKGSYVTYNPNLTYKLRNKNTSSFSTKYISNIQYIEVFSKIDKN